MPVATEAPYTRETAKRIVSAANINAEKYWQSGLIEIEYRATEESIAWYHEGMARIETEVLGWGEYTHVIMVHLEDVDGDRLLLAKLR